MNKLSTPSIEAAWKTIEAWTQNIHSGDIEAILQLYCDKDNAFWGTFGDHVRCTREDVRTYFDSFLDVAKMNCTITEFAARELTAEVVSFTGIYVFDIQKTKDSPVTKATARFTFTVRHDKPADRWMLVEHHSSLMPENGY